jgi:hypothetical protein
MRLNGAISNRSCEVLKSGEENIGILIKRRLPIT